MKSKYPVFDVNEPFKGDRYRKEKLVNLENKSSYTIGNIPDIFEPNLRALLNSCVKLSMSESNAFLHIPFRTAIESSCIVQ